MERVERVVVAGDMMILGGVRGEGRRAARARRVNTARREGEPRLVFQKLSSIRKKYTKVDKY